MMWAALLRDRLIGPVFFRLQPGRGGGMTARRYIDQVLQPVVVPFFAGRPALTFQRDNAPAYTAMVTQVFIRNNNIPNMD